MKFDNNAQLQNHVKKFCVESEYGTQGKLEEKYQMELKSKYRGSVGNFPPEETKQSQRSYVGESLEALQTKTRDDDEEFKR